jgi:WD domain, G-beta repeat
VQAAQEEPAMPARLLKTLSLLALCLGLLAPAAAHADAGPIQRIGNGAMTSLAASPDGRTLAVGTTIGIYFLDADTLDVTGFWDVGGWVTHLQYSADGQYLRVTRATRVNKYTGKETVILGFFPRPGAIRQTVFDVASALPTSSDPEQGNWIDHRCSFDGDYCADLFQDHVIVHNENSGEDVGFFRQWYTLDAAWSPDTSKLYTTSEGTIKVWERTHWRMISQLEGYFSQTSLGEYYWYLFDDPAPTVFQRIWHDEDRRLEYLCMSGESACEYPALGTSNSRRIREVSLERVQDL